MNQEPSYSQAVPVACSQEIILRFRERHLDPNNTANQLQPALRAIELGDCAMKVMGLKQCIGRCAYED